MIIQPSFRPNGKRRRLGLTLVELIAVMAIMLLLAALGVLFVPSLGDRQRASQAAERLQSWLLLARTTAKKDRLPTGIRLLPGTVPGEFSALQYVQLPDSFSTPGRGLVVAPANQQSSLAQALGRFDTFDLVSTGVPAGINDLALGGNPQDPLMKGWAVQPGDSLELPLGGPWYRIASLASSTRLILAIDAVPTASGPFYSGGLLTTFNLSTTTPQDYRIHRKPRPLVGESILQMPEKVTVDAKTNVMFGNPLPAMNPDGTIDILFGVDGSVANRSGCDDKIIFWVRSTEKPIEHVEASQTLVAVDARSGAVSSYAVTMEVATTSSSALAPGAAITSMTVANTNNIKPGDFLVVEPYFDSAKAWTLPSQPPPQPPVLNVERVRVKALMGNNVILDPVSRLHPYSPTGQPVGGTYIVISDPYAAARDPRGSGI